jgi:ABC-type polysaccharide/polyol phosphate transport system ATPase subunit
VADEAFQQKCQQKLQQVKEAGRTVLIVSHNMELIQNLCARAILLEQGRILLDGPAEEVALHYLELSRARSDAGRCMVPP